MRVYIKSNTFGNIDVEHRPHVANKNVIIINDKSFNLPNVLFGDKWIQIEYDKIKTIEMSVGSIDIINIILNTGDIVYCTIKDRNITPIYPQV